MATEYLSLKVPDLKKLLQERGLAVSGNKAELITRLQEDDKKSKAGTAGEDEIDWDEDEKTTNAVPAVAPTPTSTSATLPTVGTEVPVQTQESKTDDAVARTEEKPSIAPILNPTTTSKSTSTADKKINTPQETPNPDVNGTSKGGYTLGLGQSDSMIEAEKRAARAKRFGIPQSEEAIKMAERAKKFQIPPSKDEVVQSLDTALPENRPKRMRNDKDKAGSRPEKRQETDRRTEFKSRSYKSRTGLNKMAIAAILDDPVEKAKAEARAKRFARPVVT